ncbi:MAG: hypothetical protein MRJ96_05380 [Nitrospirales bacterium]|nr:hypothetical protein [Nitrospirales bacterium]
MKVRTAVYFQAVTARHHHHDLKHAIRQRISSETPVYLKRYRVCVTVE